MSLSNTRLRDAIKTKVEAATGNTMPSVSLDIWTAVAEAIVEEIITHAEISGTTASACTAGGATGTMTGTVS